MENIFNFICGLTEKVIDGQEVTHEESLRLLKITSQRDTVSFMSCANTVRDHFKGPAIDLCAIINAKSGSCSEDCAFCPQSAHYHADIESYPLVHAENIVEKSKEASRMGAKRFGIVVSGENVKDQGELERICSAIERMCSDVDIGRCASLGTLTREAAKELKRAGLERYHHNLETSESFFPQICTTHSYEERVKTVRTAKEEGLKVCCGGIFGLGESPEQRLELAFTLKELDVDSIPLNFLNPIPGTPLENAPQLPPMEIVKTIAVFRFIHPSKDIRVCGGRERNLRSLQPLIYLAGANATMIGNYLTTPGSDPHNDLQMIDDLMLCINSK